MIEVEPNTITAEVGAPVLADPTWMRGSGAPAPASLADQLAALRNAAGEADALAAVTVAWFDEGDWGDVDPVLVDRLASLLGLMAKATSAVLVAVDKFHGHVADAQPAAGNDRWDDEGAARPAPSALAYRADIVRRLRARCAATFDLPADHPFFGRYYREGEAPDDALFRIFEAEKRASGQDDEAVLDALVGSGAGSRRR